MTAGYDGLDDVIPDAALARFLRFRIRQCTMEDIDEQIEETMLYVLEQTRMYALAAQLLHVVPEESLTFFTVHGQERVTLGINYIAGMLNHAQDHALIDRYDPNPVAELIARPAHSLLQTPGGGMDFTDADGARLFIRTTIAPLIKHGLTPRHRDDNSGGNLHLADLAVEGPQRTPVRAEYLR